MVRETIENAIAGGKDSQFIEFLLLQGDIGLGYGQFGFGLFYVFDSSSSGQFSEFFMCRRNSACAESRAERAASTSD